MATKILDKLLTLLENHYQKLCYKGQGLEEQPVYDVINVHTTHRFIPITKVAMHNCLGLSYGMRAAALALKLTADTNTHHDKASAQAMIDMFEGVFPAYTEYRNNRIIEQYDVDEYIRLSDGWTMFGDNPNNLSVSNFPVQGKGTVILRRMLAYLQDAGLNVVRTLHDAAYIEEDYGEWDKMDVFYTTMAKSFFDAYEGHPLQEYAKIRLDIEAWGPDFPEGHSTITTPNGLEVPCQQIYVDGRATREYETFSPYFYKDIEAEIADL